MMQSSKKASLISANSTVKDAKIIKKNKYKDIFVLENNKIIGIISSNDLLIRKNMMIMTQS